VAITGFEADTESLSGYTAEELWNHFERTGTFVMVDRQNLEKLREEMNYQMSGEVSDESARPIGRQFGVQYIIYGRITRIGGDYRISAYATDVEKASSNMRALTVRTDERLSGLLSGESAGLESEIDRAVSALGRSVTGPMKIGIGRISLNGTGTVTNLSEYLKRNISHSASRQRNKYEVVYCFSHGNNTGVF
jgi:curli biogenesis system outer membrane secretion channel CsgG